MRVPSTAPHQPNQHTRKRIRTPYGPLGALLSSPALDVRLPTALQVLQNAVFLSFQSTMSLDRLSCERVRCVLVCYPLSPIRVVPPGHTARPRASSSARSRAARCCGVSSSDACGGGGGPSEKRPRMRKVSPSAPYRLRASVRFVVTPPSPKRRTPLPGATNTSPGVGPSACASSGSTHVPLKKTRLQRGAPGLRPQARGGCGRCEGAPRGQRHVVARRLGREVEEEAQLAWGAQAAGWPEARRDASRRRGSPTPGCRVGLTLHAPPVGSTRTVPACPTKEPPPGQQSCRAVRPVMLSSPGKPRSAV